MAEANIQDPFGLVGTTLEGQYRIDQVVGEGGFGVVYRGWHVALEQPIAVKALKVLADDRAVQDALFAKFKDEAKLLYTLSQASLHIVRSMDFGAVTSPTGLWAPYMVLEWLAGRSLADDLTERRKRGHRGRSLDEAFALLEPAAEGLAVAHHRRVAHRDIKPANLFLLDGEEGPRVKVLDFGIAKIIRDGEGPGTRSPFASFTWLYAAPEQLDPRLGQSGLATDVYSFALLLTELLTDRVPTDARDVVSLLKAAVDPTLRPTPRQRGAIVPDGVEVVCRRALAVDPKARFATIGELWGALTAARRSAAPLSSGQLPVSVLPPTMPAASGGAPQNRLSGPGVYAPPLTGSSPPGPHPFMSPPGPPPFMHGASVVNMQGGSQPYAPTFMHGAGSPSQGALLTHQEASALSPPRMTAPPGMAMPPRYPPWGRVQTRGPSALTITLGIIGVVIALMFTATCAVVQVAC